MSEGEIVMVGGSDKIEKERYTGYQDEISYSLYFKSSYPVFIIDNDGIFIDVNDAFCKKLGVIKEKILGMYIGEAYFLTKDGRKKAVNRHISSMLIGEEISIYTLEAIKNNGDVLSLEIESKPCFTNEKKSGEIDIVKKSTVTTYKGNIDRETQGEFKTQTGEFSDVVGRTKDKTDEIEKTQSEFDKRYTFMNLQERIPELIHDESESEKQMLHVGEMQVNLERKNEEPYLTDASLKTKNRIIEGMKKHLGEKQMIIDEKIKLFDQLNLDLKEEKKELEMKKDSIIRLQTRLEDRKEELDSKKLELDEKRKEITRTRKELESSTVELNKKQKEMQQIQKKMEDRYRRMDAWNQELNKKQEQIQIKLQQIQGGLISGNNQPMGDIPESKEEANKISQMVNNLENNQDRLSKKVEEIKWVKNELEKTKEAVKVKNMQLDIKEKDFEKLKNEFENLYTELQKMRRGLEEKDHENIWLHEELVMRKDEIAGKNQELQQTKQKFESEHGEMMSLQGEMENMRWVIKSKNAKIEELQTRLEETDREVRANRAALNWLKNDIERKNEEFKTIGEDLEKRNVEIREIKKQLVGSQMIIADKERITGQRQKELEQIKGELVAKDMELRQVKARQKELGIKDSVQELSVKNMYHDQVDDEVFRDSDVDDIKTKRFTEEK